MFEQNLQGLKQVKLPLWRKMAMSIWSLSGDPTIHCKITVPVEKALLYIEQKNKERNSEQDKKVTLTHFAGKVIAKTFRDNPAINRLFRFGRYYQRRDVDVYFLVANDAAGKDLSGKVLHQADTKDIQTLANELGASVKKIRVDKKGPLITAKKALGALPIFLIKPLVKLLGFVLYSLNLQVKPLKMDPNPFGSVMVTSIGSLGLDSAYAPLIPLTRVPFMLSIGKTQVRLRLDENKQVYEESFIELCCTADHRIIDGVHGAKMAKTITDCFDNPELLES